MNTTKTDRLAETLANVLTSPNVWDSNGEPANLVDVIEALGVRLKEAAEIIAVAIRDLADAVHEHGE